MSRTGRHRIGAGGIAIESSTFSPHPSTISDFTILRGSQLQTRYPFMPAWSFTGHENVEWLPGLHARAIPGGPVDQQSYRSMKAELLDRVASTLPLDGFFLDIHGAMNVAGMDDAEADLAAAVRNLVGPGCLIAAGMDLHGNVSQRLVELVDVLTAHRLAPHDDAILTRERACRLMLRCLDERLRPSRAWVRVPVILPGERTSTLVEPGRTIYASLDEISALPGVLDASLWVGYVWADEPRSSATVVVTGTDEEAIVPAAERIARGYWDAREQFTFGTPAGSAEWCIGRALECDRRPVVISDSGDNPTAGGVGDVPHLLERLVHHPLFAAGERSAVCASIPSAAAVAASFQAGRGSEVDVSIGGELDPVNGRPLRLRATVEALDRDDPVGGDIAVLRAGGVLVIVTSSRKPYHYLRDFARLGIRPEEHDVIAVKIGYLVPELRTIAAHALLALTPGAVNQDIVSLRYDRLTRPVYPLDRHFNPDLSARLIRAQKAAEPARGLVAREGPGGPTNEETEI